MNELDHGIVQNLGALSAHLHGVCDQLVRLKENAERFIDLMERLAGQKPQP